ncbi:MAG: tyrosine-type recombinase/integrase [Planctomycetota bacterium]
MQPKRTRTPKLCHHKASGQARVRLDGRDLYLGKFGTPEAEAAYHAVLAEWRATGETPAKPPRGTLRGRDSRTVSELILAFWKWAVERYPDREPGRMHGELVGYKSALAVLREGWGPTPAAEFGPNALRECQAMMVARGWSRVYCNSQLSRLKRAFKWAVSRELVPAETFTALQSVEGLRKGDTEASEPERRKPVTEEQFAGAKSRLSPRNGDLIELLRLTGARPAELLSLTTAKIDRSGDVWLADLDEHKTAHLERDRVLVFGPQCQAILAKYLDDRAPTVRLFRTSRNTLRQAIAGACERAGVPVWTTYQLRHTFAYRARAEAGPNAAHRLLGIPRRR